MAKDNHNSRGKHGGGYTRLIYTNDSPNNNLVNTNKGPILYIKSNQKKKII